MKNRELWEFKYEPKTLKDAIYNKDIKKQLLKAIDERPNMLLYGLPGVGKGTFVDCLIKEKQLQNVTMKINASDETGIDTMRQKVKSFSQSMATGELKLIYLNEADSLTTGPQGAQKMLRDLIEATRKNTQFIFCCNYEYLIIPELKSRCQLYNITNPPADEIFNYCVKILKKEKIEYKVKSVINLVKMCYPDIRNTFITLKQNVINNKLSDQIVQSTSNIIFKSILDNMKKDPGKVRQLLKSNAIHYEGLYSYLYTYLMDNNEESIFNNEANAIIHVGESSYKSNMVANKEIEFMHMYFNMIKDKTIKLG